MGPPDEPRPCPRAVAARLDTGSVPLPPSDWRIRPSVTVPGVGTLIFNEQVRSGPRQITVNAVRLHVAAAPLALGDIVFAQFTCGIEP